MRLVECVRTLTHFVQAEQKDRLERRTAYVQAERDDQLERTRIAQIESLESNR